VCVRKRRKICLPNREGSDAHLCTIILIDIISQFWRNCELFGVKGSFLSTLMVNVPGKDGSEFSRNGSRRGDHRRRRGLDTGEHSRSGPAEAAQTCRRPSRR
jgi:hypothetical protein